LVTRITSTT